MRQRERDNLVAVLNKVNWQVFGPDGAAALLGVKPTTLASRIRKMGITKADQD
jgi:transcriptional regulator with GAF, ATPase, and Fis domain